MRRKTQKGLYHIALILIAFNTFNDSIHTLTGANLGERLFAGVTIPTSIMAIILCTSAVLVIWHNWVD